MRTSLDLPDELMRKARIAAVQRGLTFRELVIRALGTELSVAPPGSRRLNFPLAESGPPGSLGLGRDKVLEAELEDDLRRSGLLD